MAAHSQGDTSTVTAQAETSAFERVVRERSPTWLNHQIADAQEQIDKELVDWEDEKQKRLGALNATEGKAGKNGVICS